ncbi:unnamed protein product [Darwinula stevensoni]|uniref:Ras-related protein Rab-43 n=1 Tax=Darwinula stevensoni TaxID=69355 RepID=A0A7R9AF16_9CRUS|nr:unnamed protein product [Darwinula stevensoni]CAG0902652.1 unnamed protein product [Darwinula stevensoni]
MNLLQIWDTAGQERFRTITQSYYRSANGVILVYDISKRSSFLSLQRWIDEVRKYTTEALHMVLIVVWNVSRPTRTAKVDPLQTEAYCRIRPVPPTLSDASPDSEVLLAEPARGETSTDSPIWDSGLGVKSGVEWSQGEGVVAALATWRRTCDQSDTCRSSEEESSIRREPSIIFVGRRGS